MNMIKEFEIDLTTSQDCEFVLDVVKNTKTMCELYSNNYDGGDHISCVLYVDNDGPEELLRKFPVFENISYDEYELDEESNDSLVSVKKSVIDDIYELKDIYTKFDRLFERYKICDKN